MKALQRVTIALYCAAVVLAAVNLVLFVNRPADDPATGGENLSGWERWRAMDSGQRVACVRRYQAISRRADARATWRHAREFGRLAEADQDRVREVLAVLRDTLDRQPPTRRRDLLGAPARVRAYEAYLALLAEDPGRVAQLRDAWAGLP